MLAFMEGVRYKSYTVELSPGDALFLYTDGVTEAMDPKGVLFGDNRLMETFSVAPSSEPASLCSLVRLSVAAFVAGAPAADDLTVLAVEYVSRPNRRVRSFPPTQDGISAASEFLDNAFADGTPLASRLSSLAPALHVILDEIASNIIKHSKASGFELDVEFSEDPACVKLTFIDDGVPYDPLSHVDPDTTLAAGERPIGGLGLLMVKKMSDATSYERKYNRNFFIVSKNAP
jgi:sigma-B regulation protein RsbU (phosphoserine phosphatase)